MWRCSGGSDFDRRVDRDFLNEVIAPGRRDPPAQLFEVVAAVCDRRCLSEFVVRRSDQAVAVATSLAKPRLSAATKAKTAIAGDGAATYKSKSRRDGAICFGDCGSFL
jgi:hypothetical protein